MLFSIANRALFRGVLAGAVIFAGPSACSRSDRTESGSDTTAAVLPDTMNDQAASNQTGTAPATRPSTDTAAAGYRGMERDTSTTPGAPTGRDTATAPAEPVDTSRAVQDTSETSAAPIDTTAPTETYGAEQGDTIAQAEQAEQADTVMQAEGDVALQARVDTARTDTAVAGYAKMARDTSTAPEQVDAMAPVDTVAQAEGDVALQPRVDTEADTAAIHAQADTTAAVPTEVAVEISPDTVTVVGDSSSVDKPGPRAKEDTIATKADSLAQYHEAERIRPPEDSTEILGNVTGDENADEADASREDRETVAAAEARAEPPTDEVGAAAIGGNVTGSQAVSLMTRQGARCMVVDPESDEAVRWDMASTPVTLNPCGLGSMNLSKIWTER